jgi:hypothetical protein
MHPNHNSNQPVRNGVGVGTRYSREDALDIFRRMDATNGLDRGVENVFQGSWDPMYETNGAPVQTARGDAKDQYPGPEYCWDSRPIYKPFGLQDYTDEEKEVE